jgi:hypothetical protein
MAVVLTGTVKSARLIEINVKKTNTKTQLVALDIADEIGNVYPCQMWPDDAQHAELAAAIDNLRRQPVQVTFSGYSARMRTMADGKERAQVNFIVTNVIFGQHA